MTSSQFLLRDKIGVGGPKRARALLTDVEIGGLQYVELWFLVNMNISSYQAGSSLIATRMNFWQAIIVILVGDLIASTLAVANSISGARSHFGYPIVSRSVWGEDLLWSILLSLVWYGVQAAIGGKMVFVCLRAIWPSIDNVKNTFPDNIGITVAQFIGYIIFNIMCCIVIWYKPTKLRFYFHIGAVLVIITDLSLLIWSLAVRQGDYGTVFTAPGTLSGALLLGACVLGLCPLEVLRPEFSIKMITPDSQKEPVKLLGLRAFHLTAVLHSSRLLEWWSQLQLKKNTEKELLYGTPLNFSFLFKMMVVSINFPGNILARGIGTVSVFPKYINFRRGAYLLAVLSVVPNPWQQLASGSTFLSVLSAYAVFLNPFIGLLITYYWLIQRRVFHTPDLYEGSKRSVYWYTYGVNWRSAAPSMLCFCRIRKRCDKMSVIFYALHWIFPVDYRRETELESEVGESTGS
ncbi:hypothetical protein G7Y89_g7428 [Cudoniella acicularis]|uniref:Uncharacterized protein n=1 Tax=Cudoniella acicularis TaxID=354080 RepID=A0A8H4RKY3_9HELO|nr:hypothetical protein G7Y89_g7428 [Cudoniella acicularis]